MPDERRERADAARNRRAILRATEELLATQRPADVTIEQVAARLGNTVTICRKCYVHPEIIRTYLTGSLADELAQRIKGELRDEKGLLLASAG